MTLGNNIPCQKCAYDPTAEVVVAWQIWLCLEAQSINRLRSNGRGAWAYRKYKAKAALELKQHSALVKKATGKRRVTFTRVFSGRQRHLDGDNLVAGLKPLRDGLTELGMIVDDSPKWLEAHYEQVKGPEAGIKILIEDIKWREKTPKS